MGVGVHEEQRGNGKRRSVNLAKVFLIRNNQNLLLSISQSVSSDTTPTRQRNEVTHSEPGSCSGCATSHAAVAPSRGELWPKLPMESEKHTFFTP